MASFTQGANVLTISKGEDAAAESLDYSRFIHGQLPPFLRLSLGKDQSSLMTFPAMYSKIRALPSTEDAAVGFGGATRVVLDECEYHPYDRKNYSEILPPILEGGQLVVPSTADPLKSDTLFKELYTAARHGDSDFYPVFFPYDVVPGRTVEWYSSLPRTGLRSWEIQGRFPRNEKEALSTLKSRQFFDGDVLDAMYADCLNPIDHEISDKFDTIKIFRLPEPGVLYCVFTDPSYGRDDPHATIVIKVATGEQVAESHGKLPTERVGIVHDALVRLYNNAFNSFELNAEVGNLMRETLEILDTPNQAPFIKPDGKTDLTKKGWWTGKQTRPKMLWGLEEAVRLRQIIPRSKECLDEFSHIMLPEGEEPQTPRGMHDDYTMAWAGVWQIKGYTPRKTGAGFKSWTRREITY